MPFFVFVTNCVNDYVNACRDIKKINGMLAFDYEFYINSTTYYIRINYLFHDKYEKFCCFILVPPTESVINISSMLLKKSDDNCHFVSFDIGNSFNHGFSEGPLHNKAYQKRFSFNDVINCIFHFTRCFHYKIPFIIRNFA